MSPVHSRALNVICVYTVKKNAIELLVFSAWLFDWESSAGAGAQSIIRKRILVLLFYHQLSLVANLDLIEFMAILKLKPIFPLVQTVSLFDNDY